jgi:competence CoiA-like predicted nuclease
MNCYVCGGDLIWGGDHDLEDDDTHPILTNLSCPACESFVIVYHGNEVREREDHFAWDLT